jgi:iduronate 2-sulfatase
MTGRRPDATLVWNLNDNWRVKHQFWTTLPGMFLAAGYLSLGTGKTYHDTVQDGVEGGLFEYDRERSWSPEALPYRNPCWTQGIDCGGCPDRLKGIDPKDEEEDSEGGGEAAADAADAVPPQQQQQHQQQQQQRALRTPPRWVINNVTIDWCVRETGDLSDVLTTDHAVTLLNAAVAQQQQQSSNGTTAGRPFYLAVGYHKPHMPWIFKQEHLDLYPLAEVAVAAFATLDSSVPTIAFNDNDSPSPWEALPHDSAVAARRAYYAATTGMDEQVGRLLGALASSAAASTTAVLLHGDHGWQLGERAGWHKNSNWENAVRTPLIVAVPWLATGMPGRSGGRTSALAELIDVLPTLADLAGIPVPGWGNPNASNGNLGGLGSGIATVRGDEHAPPSGLSLVPILNGTANGTSGSNGTDGGVHTFAFSQYPRAPASGGGDPSTDWQANGIDHKSPVDFEFMGYSVRCDEWRYTAWFNWLGPVNGTLKANFSDYPYARELYDWRGADNANLDYDSYENVNVAEDEENAEVVSWLNAVLLSQFS